MNHRSQNLASFRPMALLMALALTLGAFLAPTAMAAETPAVQQPAEAPLFQTETAELVQGCIQVIVWAKNPGTGECVQYPTPCDAPRGWDVYYTQAECEAAAS